MALLKAQAQQVPTPGTDMDMIGKVLRRHGIDLQEEQEAIEHEERMKIERARQVEATRRQQEAEVQHSTDVALQLIKDGHMIIKIDGEKVDDLTAPCPACGASLGDVAYTVREFAERYWRQAGGNMDMLIQGEGAPARTPLSLTMQKCPKCATTHRVTVQIVL